MLQNIQNFEDGFNIICLDLLDLSPHILKLGLPLRNPAIVGKNNGESRGENDLSTLSALYDTVVS